MLGLPLISSNYLHLGCFSPRCVAVVLADSVHCFLVGDTSTAMRSGSPVAALSKQSALVEQATAVLLADRELPVVVLVSGAILVIKQGQQAESASRAQTKRAES
jgi:ABC-type uncharacterized transport system ATPase subunit